MRCGVQLDGTMACWGTTGLDPPSGTYTQVAVGDQQACALGIDAHLACWGTGVTDTTPSHSLTFSQISMAGTHGCGVQTDGTASCFGTGASSPERGDSYVAVGTGAFGSCGVQTTGKAVCWDRRRDGSGTQLRPPTGLGRHVEQLWRAALTARSPARDRHRRVSPHRNLHRSRGRIDHSCAVPRTARRLCWGDDNRSVDRPDAVTQVAVGDATLRADRESTRRCVLGQYTGSRPARSSRSARTDTRVRARHRRTVQCWGDLEVVPTDSFLDVSAGSGFSCGVKSDATLTCWGTDLAVHYAAGGTSRLCRPAPDSHARSRPVAPPPAGDEPPTPPPDTFIQLSAGDGFVCGIDASAAVACWGDNSSGQSAARSLIVGPFDQGLDFSLDTAAVVDGSSTVTVTTGATGKLVTLISETLAVCTTDGSTVQFLKAQQCTLQATEPGDVDYADADVEKPFTVSPATPSVTVVVPGTTVAHDNFTAAATSSGHDDGAFSFAVSADPSDSCRLDADSTTVHLDHAGQCTVTANEVATADYNPGIGSNTFPIGQLTGSVSISSVAPASAEVGDSYTPSTQAGGSSTPVSVSVSPSNVCSLTNGVVSFDHHGVCTVQAAQPGDRDYTDAVPDTQQIAVGSAAQAINVNNVPNAGQVGDVYTPVTDAEPSNNPVTFKVDPATTNGACTVASGVVHYQHVGSCVLHATVAAKDGDYKRGDLTLGAIPVGKGSLSINWPTAPALVYVGDDYTPSADPTPAGLPRFSIDASTPSTVCQYAGGVVQFTGKGSCVVDAKRLGNADYNDAPQRTQTIIVSRVASSVGLDLSLGEVVYGQATSATASVTHTPSNRGAPDGTIQFKVAGANAGGPVAVSAGDASEPITAPAAGGTPVAAAFTPANSAKYDTAHTNTTLQVDQAGTKAPVTVKPHAISTKIEVKKPGAGVPTGTVQFAVDGAPVGDPQPLSDGVATLTYSVPTGQTRHISASYPGDANFVPTTGSTARHDPRLTASVTSADPEHNGWYRTPVTVKFSCTPVGAPLHGSCPQPVTVAKDVAARTVSKSILATNGGAATYATSISLDQTKPTVVVAGVTDGTTYIGKAPKARCLPSDSLSGVASCHIVLTTDATGKTTYTATATDKAGNAASVTGSYRVQRYYLREAIYDASNNSYIVQTGTDYTLVALAAHRPHYYKPVRLHHTPHVDGGKLSADGKQAGLARWTLTVSFGKALRKHTFWNIGVVSGGTVHPILLRVS